MKLLMFILIYYVCIVRSKFSNHDFGDALKPQKTYYYDNEKDQSESYCALREDEQNEELKKMNDIIKEGNQAFKLGKEENTILVLGNAGSGKTTFVQFMAGDNSKLISKETGNDTGDFLIYGDKIGSSPTESFTLYPEQVAKSGNASFTDTPGFSDTRSEIHEVVASYAMKKYLSGIRSVKIVLLVTYYSLEQGVYKEDFIDLLKHLNDFVKNVDEHQEGVALIATKVPNKYKVKGSNTVLIPDEKIIADIGEYLFKVQNALTDKRTKTKTQNKIQFLEKAIKILKGLQEVDENGRFKRINVFHRPTIPGVLTELEELQKSKQSLQKTLYENVAYTQISNDDIGYSLSYRAETYLNSIVKCLNEKITTTSKTIFEAINNHFKTEMKNYKDIYTLYKKEESITKELKTLQNDLKNSNNFQEFFKRLDSFITEKGIPGIDKTNSTKFLEVLEYTNNIKPFINLHSIFSTVIWAEQMKFMLDDFEERSSWNNFLIELFEHFSTFTMQKSKTDGANTSKSNDTLKTVLTNFDASLYDNFNNFNTLMSDDDKIGDLKEIVSMTLDDHSKAKCDTSGKLTIEGNYVKISTFSGAFAVRNLCQTTPLKTVIIYAVHTVFIDEDIKETDFQGVDFMIVAPKWEVIGSRHIDLSGTSGEQWKSTAKHGSHFDEPGLNGKPGSPGKNGGNFLGIGLQFINSENLVISVSGGNGGIGQHGGNGHKGKNGKDGYKQFYNDVPSITNAFDSFHEGYDQFPYVRQQREISRVRRSVFHYFNNPDESSQLQHVQTEMTEDEYNSDEPIIPLSQLPEEMMENQYNCAGNITIYTHHGTCGNIGSSGGDGGKGGFGGKPGSALIIGDNSTSPNFIIHNFTGNLGTDGLGGTGGLKGNTGMPITCIKTTIRRLHEYYKRNHEYRDLANKEFWTCRNWYLTEPKNKCDENERGPNGRTGSVVDGILEPTPTKTYDFSPDLYNYVTLLKEYDNNKYLTRYTTKLQNVIYNNVFFKTNSFWKFILIPQTGNALQAKEDKK